MKHDYHHFKYVRTDPSVGRSGCRCTEPPSGGGGRINFTSSRRTNMITYILYALAAWFAISVVCGIALGKEIKRHQSEPIRGSNVRR